MFFNIIYFKSELHETSTQQTNSESSDLNSNGGDKSSELAASNFVDESSESSTVQQTTSGTQQITSGSSRATSTHTEIEKSSEAVVAPKKRSITRKSPPISAKDAPNSTVLVGIDSVEPTAAKKKRYARKAKPTSADTEPAESNIGYGNLPQLDDLSTATIEIDWRVLPTSSLLDFFCDNCVFEDDVEGLLKLYYGTLDQELKSLIEIIFENFGELISNHFLDSRQIKMLTLA